jgi:hypothetical protein
MRNFHYVHDINSLDISIRIANNLTVLQMMLMKK